MSSKDTAQLEVTFNFHGKSRDVVARDLSADGAGTLAFQEHATFRNVALMYIRRGGSTAPSTG